MALMKFLIASCLLLAANGFRISFLSVPSIVNRLSPDPQRLSCAVHQTAGEQAHITSIVMIRENTTTDMNDTIALVTAYAAPHASVDGDHMVVTGGVKPGQATGEFLTVEWPVPGDAVLGNYYCEVFGLDHLGHPLNLVEAAVLHAPSLDIQDVINYIIVLQNNQNQLKNQVSDLIKNCAGCGQNVTTRLAEAEDSIALLESAVASSSQQVETVAALP